MDILDHATAAEFLVAGLHRLEYRGYDSSGVATITPDGAFAIVKTAGHIDQLEALLATSPIPGHVGIGHTRWATHGAPDDNNAHPHIGGDGTLAVVHNGVHRKLSGSQTSGSSMEGYLFHSSTDSEVHRPPDRQLPEGATNAPSTNEFGSMTSPTWRPSTTNRSSARSRQRWPNFGGTYGLVVLFRQWPELLIAARRGSPLIVGVGDDEYFVASDASPLAGYTDRIVYMADHELAVITAENLRVIHRDQGSVDPSIHVLDFHEGNVAKGGFDHYMLKEIYEQPEAIENAMRGRLDLDEATAKFGGFNLTPQQLRTIGRIIITGCGTSWHAGLVGEHQIETLARLPVEVEYASELRYRNPPLDNHTLLFAITQSGETADTLAAIREMQRKGCPALGICNVVGSSIAQETDGGFYLRAGPEIGVASTKAFTSQCTVLAMLALYFGRLRHLSFTDGMKIIEELQELPDKVRETLQCATAVRHIAEKYAGCNNFLYLGRQFNFPTALEGALKLKEISYIHAEGYPSAEMKHGPIALVDHCTPSVFLMPHSHVYDKVLSNVQEIKARGGPIITVVCRGDTEAALLADDVIEIPSVAEYLQPIITAIPLQLLAYYIAVARGCDVDKPRNLAKSVTVE